MKQLSYKTINDSNYNGYLLQDAPERILQFGEGNFLRAFVDYFVDVANEKCGFNSKVVVVQPIAQGLTNILNEQDGLYTLYLRGMENNKKVDAKRVISSISRGINPYTHFGDVLLCAENPALRYIVSNTTEAGIAYDETCQYNDIPPASFPAKLTRFLHHRFTALGAKDTGLVVLSCELIDYNGDALRKCVGQYIQLWDLPSDFLAWVQKEVLFCNTLVDRIVTGYPKAEYNTLNKTNGYEDKLLNTGEVFGNWVIEGPKTLEEELPFAKAGLPVYVVKDHSPYKQRKVRILNGAHTSMVLAAYLAGQNIVRDCMYNEDIASFMNRAIYEEIIPTLTLPKQEVSDFAASVTERFKNPFIDHSLLAIALNSSSKWRFRVLPSVLDYVKKNNALPACLTFSFAAYLAFYQGIQLTEQGLVSMRGNEEYIVNDDRFILELFFEHREDDAKTLVETICKNQKIWGQNLCELESFTEIVTKHLVTIQQKGMQKALHNLLQ